jgi:Fic family protein
MNIKKYKKKFEFDSIDFLSESNYIEGEYSEQAFYDAIKAWRYIYEKNPKLITVNNILKIHEILLKNIRKKIAGKTRDCNVYIGGKLKPFISNQLFISQLLDWCDEFNMYSKLNKEDTLKKVKELFVKKSHINFENIHPFEDGNGRVGRILYNFLRYKLKLPVKIIRSGEEQIKYYKWFNY